MLLDNQLQLSSAQAITSTAASTNPYDITGAGAGNAPAMTWGNSTVVGGDVGRGDGAAAPVYAIVTFPTAFVSGGGATLQVQIRAAVDNGSNSPGSYTVISQSGLLSVANLNSGYPLLLPIPPLTLGEALPRFYDLNYVVATSTFSAGAVTAWFGIGPANLPVGIYPNNYTVGA